MASGTGAPAHRPPPATWSRSACWHLCCGRMGAGLRPRRRRPPRRALLRGRRRQPGRGHGLHAACSAAPAPTGRPASRSLISLGYRVFGLHVKLGLALNVVLGGATALLLYLVAREAMGRAAGLVAGSAFAVLPAPIFFTGLFLAETTFLFMLVGFLALALFLPDRRWTPVVLGVAAGLAALTKGEGVLLPVIALAMWWGQTVPRRVAAARRSCSWGHGADDPAVDDPQRDRDGRLHPGRHQRQHDALVGAQQRGERRADLRAAVAAGAHPERAQLRPSTRSRRRACCAGRRSTGRSAIRTRSSG